MVVCNAEVKIVHHLPWKGSAAWTCNGTSSAGTVLLMVGATSVVLLYAGSQLLRTLSTTPTQSDD